MNPLGDHDMTFPYVGTQKWIKSLKLRVETPWKPWFVRNQVAGYAKTYLKAKYSMKYATIKGAGHSVAIYKPEEAMVIVETWLASHTNSTK
nr:peptidase S10, serine carboxypeptidase, alpha/beta hydrolase fold protein [Tanacetum cinerariifolium]